MSEFRLRRIPTVPAVYAAIYATHKNDMTVFGSISQPCGNPSGDPEQARMYTEWGFRNADFPIIAVDTTWRIDPQSPSKRTDERSAYYLCVGQLEAQS